MDDLGYRRPVPVAAREASAAVIEGDRARRKLALGLRCSDAGKAEIDDGDCGSRACADAGELRRTGRREPLAGHRGVAERCRRPHVLHSRARCERRQVARLDERLDEACRRRLDRSSGQGERTARTCPRHDDPDATVPDREPGQPGLGEARLDAAETAARGNLPQAVVEPMACHDSVGSLRALRGMALRRCREANADCQQGDSGGRRHDEWTSAYHDARAPARRVRRGRPACSCSSSTARETGTNECATGEA